jgi:hypothetical protein
MRWRSLRPVQKLIDLVPRALAAGAGLLTALWGLRVSRGFVKGNEPAGMVAGAGMLLGTPVLALAAAAFVFWFYSLLLAPVRLAADVAQARRRHD